MIWRLSDIVVGRPTQADATKAGGAHKARLERIAARGQSAVWPFADSINAAMLRHYEVGSAATPTVDLDAAVSETLRRIADAISKEAGS